MNTASIKPLTVNGIKQLAKKISREHNITHTDALNLASRQAGYENFVHAKRQLPVANATRGFPVYISVHWFTRRARKDDQTPNGLRHGRELLCVHLSRPLPEIVAKHLVSHARGLYGFRMEYIDHLEHRTNVDSQEAARDRLLKAERSLRFMEATGLQPVSTKKFASISRVLTEMPERDHDSDWFDPVSGTYVCLDEPYAAAVKGMEAKRAHWLESNGLKWWCPSGRASTTPANAFRTWLARTAPCCSVLQTHWPDCAPSRSPTRGPTKRACATTILSAPNAKRMQSRADGGRGRLTANTTAPCRMVAKSVSRHAGVRPKRCHLSCICNLPL